MTGRRLQLGLASAGLLLGALDAYAVVTLLPQMLDAVDLPIDHIEAAAPVVSGFLGGYVVAMPLLGAFSDARGRLPAYSIATAVFAVGSLLTALAPALGWLVAGRVLQGLGGGALVPLSLSLAADLFPLGGRSLAIGAVSGIQEAGSVLGPVYGSVLAAGLGGWRAVFLLNLPLAGLIVAGLWLAARRGPAERPAGERRQDIDWVGSVLLGCGLGLAVLALYPDDPGTRAVNAHVLQFAAAACVVLVGFGWSQARRVRSLVSPDLLRSRAFSGSLATNLLAGGGLMVVLVDVPVLARGVYELDTLHAGLLLMRFLVGIPLGAVLGGWLAGRLGPRVVATAGLLIAAGAFVPMSSWALHELTLNGWLVFLELAICGFGFGLVIAPLTTAVLDRAATDEYGLASAMVVLSRTVGMVLALSALTAFGLARLQQLITARQCGAATATPGSLSDKLHAYEDCVRGALLQEYREIFLIAAGLCVLAAGVALATAPGRHHPRPSDALSLGMTTRSM